MKLVLFIVIIVCLSAFILTWDSLAHGQWSSLGLPTLDLTGTIIFSNDQQVEYTELQHTGDWPFVERLADIEALGNRSTGSPREIKLSTVSSVVFLKLDEEEQRAVKAAPISEPSLRKARVVFNDGSIYDGVYLYGAPHWESERESGSLLNPMVSSFTIKVKGAKKCSDCGRSFKQSGYKYCPFDATTLR